MNQNIKAFKISYKWYHGEEKDFGSETTFAKDEADAWEVFVDNRGIEPEIDRPYDGGTEWWEGEYLFRLLGISEAETIDIKIVAQIPAEHLFAVRNWASAHGKSIEGLLQAHLDKFITETVEEAIYFAEHEVIADE